MDAHSSQNSLRDRAFPSFNYFFERALKGCPHRIGSNERVFCLLKNGGDSRTSRTCGCSIARRIGDQLNVTRMNLALITEGISVVRLRSERVLLLLENSRSEQIVKEGCRSIVGPAILIPRYSSLHLQMSHLFALPAAGRTRQVSPEPLCDAVAVEHVAAADLEHRALGAIARGLDVAEAY
jgi:hypothetical protein